MERGIMLSYDWAKNFPKNLLHGSQYEMQKDRGHVMPWYAFNKYRCARVSNKVDTEGVITLFAIILKLQRRTWQLLF